MWLIVALAPYLAIAAADAWMHERARKVPMREQWVHAGLAATLTVFLAAVFTARAAWAAGALAAFVLLVCIDEVGFHRGIAVLERRVHMASWLALAGFVVAWQVIDR
jgi:hypothetical protein